MTVSFRVNTTTLVPRRQLGGRVSVAHLTRLAVLLTAVVAAGSTAGSAEGKRAEVSSKPLVLAGQGSFFVGGESKAVRGNGPAGDITVNQMYVQYQTPPDGTQHVPVVMIHGCCLSSKTWETTPDGRMGWSEYFVRRGRSVYLADQVGRARSGFDPSTVSTTKTGDMPSNILDATHQVAWTVFRFGPAYGKTFSDEQFPTDAVDELYKQMIPDLNPALPMPNPTLKNMAALAGRVRGAVLMGHSESGFFPEQAALVDPSGVRGIVSIEMPCVTTLSQAEVATLAKIPTLIMFGDHLGDVQGGPANWAASFESCQTFVKQLNAAGGDAEMMHLPALGIHGNSHMLMQDRNNLQLADLVIAWIDKHVDGRGGKRR